MFKENDTVGIVVNSNGQSILEKEKIEKLIKILKGYGLNMKCTPFIYQKENVFSSNAQQKANIMMEFYRDKDIKAIFDISGGDLANSIIDLLDYESIQNNPKIFFGYSDLTCVINALYAKTHQTNILYSIKNLLVPKQQIQFYETMFNNSHSLYQFQYRFIQGKEMAGIVVGGNIRCFLKLAGTKYFPDMNHKILFLESLGGESALIYSHLIHLKQLGVFEKINGIILGTFTVMEKKNCQPSVIELLTSIVDQNMPIVKTQDIGHSQDSKALMIGKYITLTNNSEIYIS